VEIEDISGQEEEMLEGKINYVETENMNRYITGLRESINDFKRVGRSRANC
jgi:hypothetical protein